MQPSRIGAPSHAHDARARKTEDSKTRQVRVFFVLVALFGQTGTCEVEER